MIEFGHYVNAFSNLHTAKMKGHKTPHKAVLLLAIIDLVEDGTIATPRIVLSDELIDSIRCGIITWEYLPSFLLTLQNHSFTCSMNVFGDWLSSLNLICQW